MGLLIVILLAVAGILIVPKLVGYQSLAVLSGSMEPEISVGSIVFIKEEDPSQLKKGDVITYRLSGDTRVTHRIVEIHKEDQTILTKGDANENMDGSPVPFQNVEGKVQFHVPYLGYISIYIKTPVGIAAGCGILILIILLNFLPDIICGEENKNRDKGEKV